MNPDRQGHVADRYSLSLLSVIPYLPHPFLLIPSINSYLRQGAVAAAERREEQKDAALPDYLYLDMLSFRYTSVNFAFVKRARAHPKPQTQNPAGAGWRAARGDRVGGASRGGEGRGFERDPRPSRGSGSAGHTLLYSTLLHLAVFELVSSHH